MAQKVSGIRSFFELMNHQRSRSLFRIKGQDIVTESCMVKCPYCGYMFDFQQYKYFGVASFTWMKILIMLLLLGFIAIPILIIFQEL